MYSSEDLEINYSENMATDEKDRFIQYLVDKVNTYKLDKRVQNLQSKSSSPRLTV